MQFWAISSCGWKLSFGLQSGSCALHWYCWPVFLFHIQMYGHFFRSASHSIHNKGMALLLLSLSLSLFLSLPLPPSLPEVKLFSWQDIKVLELNFSLSLTPSIFFIFFFISFIQYLCPDWTFCLILLSSLLQRRCYFPTQPAIGNCSVYVCWCRCSSQ